MYIGDTAKFWLESLEITKSKQKKYIGDYRISEWIKLCGDGRKCDLCIFEYLCDEVLYTSISMDDIDLTKFITTQED